VTSGDLATLNLADASFGVDFGQQIQGTPYNLSFAPRVVNDIGQLIDLCVSGCINTGFLSMLDTSSWNQCDGIAACLATPQSETIGIFDDPVGIMSAYMACLTGGDVGIAQSPLLCAALLPQDFQLYDTSGLRMLDASGHDLFVGDLAALLSPLSLNLQGNSSLADMYAQLAALGYQFGLPEFDVPPEKVPEPKAVSLLAISLMLLALQRRCRLKSNQSNGN
jgi:hypothetical protein